MTGHDLGAGRAYYLAADSDAAFYRAFYRDLFEKDRPSQSAGSGAALWRDGDGADGADGRGLLFVMNFSHDPAEIRVSGRRSDAESGETVRRDPGDCGAWSAGS